ncbi:uncharacterized protein [Palaemon carinicauda]|uniref:uncharacterized protein n=1 Tax=Palaemon carinicauda TaxID=392227 RepID=UPI0035B59B03
MKTKQGGEDDAGRGRQRGKGTNGSSGCPSDRKDWGRVCQGVSQPSLPQKKVICVIEVRPHAWHVGIESSLEMPDFTYLSKFTLSKDEWKFILMYFKISFTSSMTLRDLMTTAIDGLVEQGLILPESVTLLDDKDQEHDRLSLSSTEEFIDKIHDQKLSLGTDAPSVQKSIADVEIQKLQIERELKLAQIQFEARKLEIDREVKLAELEAQTYDRSIIQGTPNKKFNIAQQAQLVPQFNEDDPESYFRNFEKTAIQLEWPRISWTWLVSTNFKGKASIVYSTLSLEDCQDYDFVKTSILNAYTITPEGYRQNFRNLIKTPSQTYVEFATEKLRYFHKWLFSSNVTTFDQLVNLLVYEEFKRKIPLNVKLHLKDRGETQLKEAANCADVYSLVHKGNPKSDKRTVPVKPASSVVSETQDGNSRTAHPPCIDVFEDFKMTGTITLNNVEYPVNILRDTGSAQSIMLNTSPYRLSPERRKVMRDEVNFLLEHGLAEHSCSPWGSPCLLAPKPGGRFRLCTDYRKLNDLTIPDSYPLPLIDTIIDSVGQAKVHLDCGIFKGNIIVGIVESLPIPGVDVLVGKDVAGNCVVLDPVVCDTPLEVSSVQQLEDVERELFPSCVVERSRGLRGIVLTESVPSIDDQFNAVECGARCAVEDDKVFTQYGIPKVVQTDRGTNFTSKLFQDVMLAMGVHHSISTDYHPQSQGALERFHQTLKEALTKSCHEHQKEWDEGLPFVLFARRNTQQDSLGYSPSELLYGSHQAMNVERLLKSFRDLCEDVPTQTNLLEYTIILKEGTTPCKQAPYRVSPYKRAILRKENLFLLDNDLAKSCDSPWSSPCLLVRKPDGSFRLCTDYRQVNKLTVTNAYPLPRVDDLIDQVSSSKVVTRPVFQRAMNDLLEGLPGVAVYLDDVIIFTESWSDHMKGLKEVLLRLRKAVLQAPNFKKPFSIEVDASDLGTGAVLLQEGKYGILHPVMYASQKLKPHQRPYATVQKEACGLLVALEKFAAYFHCSPFTINVNTDHQPLTFLKRMRTKNHRLMRWWLMLQEYDLQIHHIKGKDNLCADMLSRNPI